MKPHRNVGDVVARWASHRFTNRGWTLLFVWASLTTLGLGQGADELSERGRKIWDQQCRQCHGSQGEGVPGVYEHRLAVPATAAELAMIIDQTMPEDDPEKCVGTDAQAVAEFILREFLTATPVAAPRIELMHLTTTQYRQAVAELWRDYQGSLEPPTQRGLTRRVYDGRELQRSKQVHETLVPTVTCDWPIDQPAEKLTDPLQYGVTWQGAFFAPDHGQYTFHLSSPNGFRLFINDLGVPVVDNWVSTAEEPDKTWIGELVGGRWYNFRLELLRVKDPTVQLQLHWEPPARQRSPIPQRFWRPDPVPEVTLLTTAFPPDDSSHGYPRGVLVSPEWEQATTEGASEISRYVLQRWPQWRSQVSLDSATEKSGDREIAAARTFCQQTAERAFGRPLSDREAHLYVDQFFNSETKVEYALNSSLTAIVKSPWFLYLGLDSVAALENEAPQDARDIRPERGEASGAVILASEKEVSSARLSRLSWILSDSLPTSELRSLVARPEFADPDQRLLLLSDYLLTPEVRAKWRIFWRGWLDLDETVNLAKDPAAFPGFDERFQSDLQESLWRFLDETWDSPACDYRTLLTADYLWLNSRLQRYYSPAGAEEPAGDAATTANSDQDSFVRVPLAADDRAGLLTHPLLLSQLAYFRTTSPIHRGVFVARQVLGVRLRPPPVAVEPLGEDYDPDLTTRERVEQQTRPENCMSCHRVINPLGFTFEGFDAVGRTRSQDRHREVDKRVQWEFQSGAEQDLHGARDLAKFLVTRREVAHHFVEQIFHHAVRQPIAAYGPDLHHRLTDEFIASGFHIRRLIATIAWEVSRPNYQLTQE